MEELKILKEITKDLPRFEDGRIDYSDSDLAVTVTIFLKHGSEILLLKRSEEVRGGRGKWFTVTGFFDEFKPPSEKAIEEIEEETGIVEGQIENLILGKIYRLQKPNKLFFIYPLLAELKDKPEISLDWEHTDYQWIKPYDIEKFDTLSETRHILERVLDFQSLK